jgi:hypothetical protein
VKKQACKSREVLIRQHKYAGACSFSAFANRQVKSHIFGVSCHLDDISEITVLVMFPTAAFLQKGRHVTHIRLVAGPCQAEANGYSCPVTDTSCDFKNATMLSINSSPLGISTNITATAPHVPCGSILADG